MKISVIKRHHERFDDSLTPSSKYLMNGINIYINSKNGVEIFRELKGC